MTMAEMQRRLEALEAEVRVLRAQAAGSPGADRRFGIFPGVPEDDEAVRLGREWREQVNGESLQEFDREREAEREAAVKKKRPKKTAKPARR